MLKYFDVQCSGCSEIKEVLLDDGDPMPVCDECGSEMKRIFTSFNFKLIFNNKKDLCSWGDNNYETSQYYRKVNEARAQGYDAHAPED